MLAFGGPNADSWLQILYLGLAVGLCACIGFERELRGKSAGIRTNAVIGVAAALVMEVSKFGFGDVVGQNVGLDPSRVARRSSAGSDSSVPASSSCRAGRCGA
jgi:putative Mg2+ transporter-C (MgtC) family protein